MRWRLWFQVLYYNVEHSTGIVHRPTDELSRLLKVVKYRSALEYDVLGFSVVDRELPEGHSVFAIVQESPELGDEDTTGQNPTQLNEFFDDSIVGDEWDFESDEIRRLPNPTDQEPITGETLLK